jgi:hypothetical protein
MAEKGKGALLLLEDDSEGDMPDEKPASDLKKTAIKTFMSAVKSNDVDAATKAFKAAYDACYADSMSEEMPEE